MRARALGYGHAVSAAERATERRERILSRLTHKAAERGLHIAYDLLGSRDQAEDAVQEALARACEACDRVREPEAAEGWFYRILTNVCMRALRRRKLRQLFFGRARYRGESPASIAASGAASAAASGGASGVAAVDAPGLAQSDNPSADRALARQREIVLLLQSLEQLPTKQRTALLLRYGHEQSITEIAGMLGVKPATVKTHLVRGLRRLRTIMERQS